MSFFYVGQGCKSWYLKCVLMLDLKNINKLGFLNTLHLNSIICELKMLEEHKLNRWYILRI